MLLAGCGEDPEPVPAPVPAGGMIALCAESALENGAAHETSTRADNAVLTYTVEVWTQGADPRCVLHETTVGTAAGASIGIRLVPGDYDFLFWADSGKGYYATDDLRQVTAATAYAPGAVGERDAFACARTGVTWSGGNSVSARLVRPLAQLTVQNAAEFAVGGRAVSIVYRGVPTRYDVLTGEASAPADATLSFPATTAGSAAVGEDFLFVPSAADAPVGLEVTVGDVTKKLDDLPLQPNYKTRITARFE